MSMREDLSKDLLPVHGEEIDPVEMARRDLKKALPKRFYAQAHFEARDGAFVLLLDGRPAQTPGRNRIALPTQAAAQLIADEWQAQADQIDPATMPITRIVNSAIDGVAREMDAVRAEIAKYAGSDLICYRASDPEALVEAQAQAWDPVLAFIRDTFGARFVLAEGVMFAEQPDHALAALRKAIDAFDSELPLATLHVMTTLTGSALIALALVHGHFDLDAAWAAAHAEEDYQMRIWGADAEALARREKRWAEMRAAHDLFQASKSSR